MKKNTYTMGPDCLGFLISVHLTCQNLHIPEHDLRFRQIVY